MAHNTAGYNGIVHNYMLVKHRVPSLNKNLTNEDIPLKIYTHTFARALFKSRTHTHTHTPNNEPRAELGQFHLLTEVHKRSLKFHSPFKTSDPNQRRSQLVISSQKNCPNSIKTKAYVNDLSDFGHLRLN